MEVDNEITGTKALYTAAFWEYDSRVGRRWNLDPVVNPSESQYSTFGDNPILYADPDGLYRTKRRARRMAKRARRAGYSTGEVYKSGKEWGFNKGKEGDWESVFKGRRFGDAGMREVLYATGDFLTDTWDFGASLTTLKGWKDLGVGVKNSGEIVLSGLLNLEMTTDDPNWYSVGKVSDAFWGNAENQKHASEWSGSEWAYNLTYGGLTLATTKGSKSTLTIGKGVWKKAGKIAAVANSRTTPGVYHLGVSGRLTSTIAGWRYIKYPKLYFEGNRLMGLKSWDNARRWRFSKPKNSPHAVTGFQSNFEKKTIGSLPSSNTYRINSHLNVIRR